MSEIKVDTVVDAAGTGKPNFSNGVTMNGAALSTLNLGEYTASSSEPSSPENGSIWWDTANEKIFIYISGEWKETIGIPPPSWYGARGLFAGGDESAVNIIDYITISSTGNATDFGDLTLARRVSPAGASNGTRAIFAGGRIDGAPFRSDTIDYVTTATLGNATDFGNCTTNLGYHHATSNGVLALILGGDASTTLSKLAQYVTIDTAGNATDFSSSVTQGTVQGCGCSNGTYSVSHAGQYYNEGGFLQSSSNIIYYMTIATSGDTTDFGDLNTSTYNSAATSDTTRGLFSGGNTINVIDYITMATPSNATDFGDLTQNTRDHAAVSDATYGVFGGNSTGTDNVISFVTIQSTGNAADFGDLTSGRHDLGAASGSAS